MNDIKRQKSRSERYLNNQKIQLEDTIKELKGKMSKLDKQIGILTKENKFLKQEKRKSDNDPKRSTKRIKIADIVEELLPEQAEVENTYQVKHCPKCTAKLNEHKIPIGTLLICSSLHCDYRKVEK